ncbi:MAG: NAD(P)/FAD-dependent oxidoreductase [Acidobacteriaceae bacterium]
MDQVVDVLVIGAGAAGLMCAARAGARGRRVVVLDHADKPGKKILISGGGRCNFTNRGATWENFLSENPQFARSALARYTAADFLELVEAHGIAWHEKTLGQLFCDRSAQEILNLLLRECAQAGVRIQLAVRVVSVTQFEAAGESGGAPRFRVETSGGVIQAESVVVATGGLSIPKMGATAFGYDVARQVRLAIVEPRAGLVPLVFAPEDQARWCDLTGLSVEVVGRVPEAAVPGVRAGRRASSPVEFREKLLVTHRGLSGPAVLQVSSYWRPGMAVEFDLAPGRAVTAELKSGSGRRDAAALAAAVRGVLPGRMAERWMGVEGPAAAGWNLSNAALGEAERRLHAWRVVPAGSEGFAKAEVTAGGVSTAELDPRTMEARRVPGLFFIGEVVAVTGWLGGYNFQWAWSSGVCAGDAA